MLSPWADVVISSRGRWDIPRGAGGRGGIGVRDAFVEQRREVGVGRAKVGSWV